MNIPEALESIRKKADKYEELAEKYEKLLIISSYNNKHNVASTILAV